MVKKKVSKGKPDKGKPDTGELKKDALKNINLRLPQDLITEMKLHCVLENEKIQDFVRLAIKERLDRLLKVSAKKGRR